MRKILFFLLVLVLLIGFVFVERHALLRTLAGTGMFKSMYVQSMIKLPHITDASSYNIYYSPASNGTFPYSVRNISNTTSSYTISYLRKDISYQYKISALNKAGKEIWWSKVNPLSDVQPM
jgi:hypothetical protein